MKTTSRLTIATVFAAFATTGAMAADLGGNCCSDLEERVAELEATTARKGNRVVSLEVSGQVSRAVVWHNDDNSNVGQFTSRDNDGRSGSRFRFRGSAKIDSNLSAGYLIEIGVDNAEVSTTSGRADDSQGVVFRHTMVYLTHKRMGTIRLGRTNSATEGLSEICLGCAITPNSAEEGSNVSDLAAVVGVDGARENGIHYVSPEMSGFVLYASWFHDTDAGQTAAYQAVANEKYHDDGWDIAVRYANEFNGIRVAAGIGYRFTENGLAPDTELKQVMGSASLMHVASGLVIQGTYGDNNLEGAGVDSSVWYLSGGISRKFNPIGATTFTVGYGQGEKDDGTDPVHYGVGISQNVDAAAMDIYMNWKHYDQDTGADDEVDVITAGARIRF